ncbi:Na+/H+ antiporter [Dawidia soli]|uniref:Na+/H+ antiporter n=1 Tax=Dawidia soli TaxID=2782352 RepID=A0AAP2DCG2_9BACT|nr:Na+/H+ antiporter [Dawidia soli]MBT1689478.1 Na+/H+ antiporter [Dawidia soli]
MPQIITLYIVLLFIILALVMLAQRLKISYPIVLVLGGLAISFVPALPEISIDPEIIFLIFLPPLLFEAAWQTSWKDFWKWRRVIGSFAFGIVILTAGVVAVVSASVIPGFTLALGFLLGGIISPPDAVSATSIMRGVQVPKRLVAIIEGESLLNDASSLVVFRFALAAVASGTFVWQQASVSFVIVIVMGTITGLVIALIFYAIIRWLPTTPSMDTVLTLIAPYAMYITAEHFHVSGVLAVVSGGLFLSSRRYEIMNHISRLQGVNVWTTLGFVLNGLVFMFIGLELPVIVEGLGPDALPGAILYGFIISVVIIITRLLSCLGASVFTVFISRFITTADSSPGWRMPLVFGWAGMRGVVSLASALSIPLLLDNGQAFPQRNMILFITFMVILITLVLQGLTLPAVIRWLQLPDRDVVIPATQQEAIIQRKLNERTLALLDERYTTDLTQNMPLQNLRTTVQNDLRFLAAQVSPERDVSADSGHRYHTIVTELIQHKRELLHKINRKEEFDEELVRKYLTQLDLEEEKLRQRFGEETQR